MPTLTVMEGREENSRIIEGYKEAAEKRGWDFLGIGEINSDKIARLDFSGVPLENIVFRELSENNYYETERILKWAEKHGSVMLNGNVVGGRTSTSDKHFQQGLFMMDPELKEAALPTFEAKNRKNVEAYLKGGRIGYPFVCKPRRGTTGDDIKLIRGEEDLAKITDWREVLIERYVEPDCDFRVFIIGGAVAGAMRKQGYPDKPDDFKAWCAGITKATEEDPEVLAVIGRMAAKAAEVSGLEYAGVDIIREKGTGRYYLLETNIAAGWSNFTPVTGVNIAEKVLDWFEARREYKGRRKPLEEIVSQYIEQRSAGVSEALYADFLRIRAGDISRVRRYEGRFSKESIRDLYDSGMIFERLSGACQALNEAKGQAMTEVDPEKLLKIRILMGEIERMPLSWAGNFIGPRIGNMEDGMILSAMWLYLMDNRALMQEIEDAEKPGV